MRGAILLMSVVFVASAYACSTSDDTVTTTPEAGTSPSTTSTTTTPPPLPTTTPTTGKDAAVAPAFDAGGNVSASQVLINEISGGDEWIELVNSGTVAQDLTGYKIADRDKDTGEAKLGEAVTFPANTVLGANAYLLVRGGGTGDAGKPCPDGGQSYCFNAELGISNKSGETVFFLAPDGGTAGKVVYPPDASSGDTSYSRFPSGDPDGGFETARATPGAPNVR